MITLASGLGAGNCIKASSGGNFTWVTGSTAGGDTISSFTVDVIISRRNLPGDESVWSTGPAGVGT